MIKQPNDRPTRTVDRNCPDQRSELRGGERTGCAGVRGRLRGMDFETASEALRPSEDGMGRSGTASAPTSGPNTPGSSSEREPERLAEGQAGMPVEPVSGWGERLGDVHGIEIRRNHVSNFAALRRGVSDVVTSGNKYETRRRSQYGLQYQCVELVNRYYALKLGHDNMAGSGNANAYMADSRGGLDTHHLPGPVKPEPGDLMVDTTIGSVGHVGVVATATDSSVTIGQQNTANAFCTASLSKTQRGWVLSGGWNGFRRKPGATVANDRASARTVGTSGEVDSARSSATLRSLVGGDPAGLLLAGGARLFEATVGILERGSEGHKVAAVQNRLVLLGFMTPAEMATGPGTFGPRTEAALRRFQGSAELPATGKVDLQTFIKLLDLQEQSAAAMAPQMRFSGPNATEQYLDAISLQVWSYTESKRNEEEFLENRGRVWRAADFVARNNAPDPSRWDDAFRLLQSAKESILCGETIAGDRDFASAVNLGKEHEKEFLEYLDKHRDSARVPGRVLDATATGVEWAGDVISFSPVPSVSIAGTALVLGGKTLRVMSGLAYQDWTKVDRALKEMAATATIDLAVGLVGIKTTDGRVSRFYFNSKNTISKTGQEILLNKLAIHLHQMCLTYEIARQ
jgi:peptidoglycan hydrolase-like protein with peptidoglycan-binding domain